ncbi:MAG: SagB/ThcOx family dehydrogenase [Cyanobacteria bacterium J06638_22]
MPNPDGSLAQHYHERTKYAPDTIANLPQPNWQQQPIPFKTYKLGTPYDLKPYLASAEQSGPSDRLWRRLAHLLFHSYGLTLKMTTMSGEAVYFRAAPSAGGLYPAEIYLISRGTPDLPSGLYHYQPQTHSLLHFWGDEVWTTLQEACFWHPSLEGTQMALVTTAIFNRSAWRYHDRAYRRICLDTGHLLGNIELATAMNDYRPHLIGGFVDEALNKLLYLEPQEEGATAIIALADLLDVKENLPAARTALPSPRHRDYPTISDGDLLAQLHHFSQIPPDADPAVTKPVLEKPEVSEPDAPAQDKYNFPFCLKVSMESEPISWGKKLVELEQTILRRRSTRAYTGMNLTRSELQYLLDFTYRPENYYEQGLERSPDYFDLGLIETFITISGVDGLEEGCYYYAPKAQEIRQIRFKNFRKELHRLCLGQDLGRDAAAVIFHTADLAKAVEVYGDRAYRYLHLDAGHLGQRLNLAAIRLQLGVSGIAGFFDDQVNEVLGIPEDEAVIYITTLGRPKRDG